MYNYCPRGHRNELSVTSKCAVCGAKMDGVPTPKPTKRTMAREIEEDEQDDDIDPDYLEFLQFKKNKTKNKNRVVSASRSDDDEDDLTEVPDIDKLDVYIESSNDRTRVNDKLKAVGAISLGNAIRSCQPPQGSRQPPPKVKPKQFLKEFLKESAAIDQTKGPTIHSVPIKS